MGSEMPYPALWRLGTARLEPPCNCESDSYDCGDFTTHDEAQDCFDYCWALRESDVHRLDANALCGVRGVQNWVRPAQAEPKMGELRKVPD